jgi:N-acetylglutamate synthase-like GNAT family acetyltransferase
MNPLTHLRNARKEDARLIRDLIHEAHINPFGLDWRHFIVAVDGETGIIGTGQIKTHYDGTRELASIAVRPAFQNRRIARQIIARLLEENPPPLYLTCRSSLGPFYQKFGFLPLEKKQLTGYFARIQRLGAIFKKLRRTGDGLLVMGKFK